MCSPKCQQDADAMAALILSHQRDLEVAECCIDELRRHLSQSNTECIALRKQLAALTQPSDYIHRGPIC